MANIRRLLIKPNTFNIYKYQKNQNPYINIQNKIFLNQVMMQHKTLEISLSNKITYNIIKPEHKLPDIVFVANGGLSLPNIKNTIILPYMKYNQRKEEL